MDNPHVKKLLSKVDSFINQYPAATQKEYCVKMQETTGLPKALIFIMVVTAMFCFMTFLGGINLIVDLVGFIYPAYMSFKSLDAHTSTNMNANKEDNAQWLTYWVVFSFIAIFESVFSFLVVFIPFYQWIKGVGIVWLYHPSTRGAQVLYEQGLRPVLMPYLEKGTASSSSRKAE